MSTWIMALIRTTIRMEERTKKDAELLAIEENTTFQEIVNTAVKEHIRSKKVSKGPVKIKFADLDLGGIDNLSRSDYYDEPDFEKYR